MNSKLATAILALVAIPLGYLASVQLRENDLTSIFGTPPRQTGETLYQFKPGAVARLTITNNAGETATFEKKAGVWIMRTPHEDRADFRTLQTLAFAAANMRIEASLKDNEVSPDKLGFAAGSYTLEFIGSDGTRLAHYQVGRRSVWHHLETEKEQVHQSLFIKPLDRDQDHIYVCSGINIRALLDPGFVALRDRHPFLFSKPHLSDIEIRRGGGLVHLARKTPTSPWRIIKPLTLRTDPEALTRLIDQLYELEALKVSNPGQVTATPSKTSAAWLGITVREFDPAGNPSDRSATLAVDPPATPDAPTTLARVDNRSGLAVFEMPLTPAKGLTSLNQLPLEVTALRSKTLLGRDFRACKSFDIEANNLNFPLFFKRVTDPRTQKPRWLYLRQDELQPANEGMIKKLRTVLEFDKVKGFASDAATALDKFALTEPDKRIVLRFGPDDEVDLRFGRTSNDQFFAMRAGSNTVVEIDAGTYTGITSTIHEWRDSLLWRLSIVDLAALTIRRAKTTPLTITYDDLLEEWSARREGEDLTALLNNGKARKFIDFLEGLRVERWLGPDHPEAARTLQSPVYVIDVRSRLVNDFGEETGMTTRTLSIARVSQSSSNQYYYGKVSGDPDYFLLDRYAAEWFAASLLDEGE